MTFNLSGAQGEAGSNLGVVRESVTSLGPYASQITMGVV